MRFQKKNIIRAGGILCLLAGPMAWLLLGNDSNLQYRTATVDRGDVNVTVSATGNPNAVVTVQVGSQVSGNILSLFADFNTRTVQLSAGHHGADDASGSTGTSSPWRPTSTRSSRAGGGNRARSSSVFLVAPL